MRKFSAIITAAAFLLSPSGALSSVYADGNETEVISVISSSETEHTGGRVSESSEEKFVKNLYSVYFDRQPSDEELSSLKKNNFYGAEAFVSFFENAGYFSEDTPKSDFIRNLFKIFPAQEQDVSVMTGFAERLVGGESRKVLADDFTKLDQFSEICSSFGVASYKYSGWQTDSSGKDVYYLEDGSKAVSSIQNIDGYTYYFDADGHLGQGWYDIGGRRYYIDHGFVFPYNRADWETAFNEGKVRYPENTDGKMDIPQDYQFLYKQPVATFFGEEKSVNTSGCGAASSSMVIRYLTGKEGYDPHTLFEWAYNNGQYYGYGLAESTLSNFLSLAGITSSWIKPSVPLITQALKEGYPVIALALEGYFTSEGHYIVLSGITDDGYVYINDPNNSTISRYTFRLDEVCAQSKVFMVCGSDEYTDAGKIDKQAIRENLIKKTSEMVTGYYGEILSRKPSEAELDEKVEAFISGKYTLSDFFCDLIFSDEYYRKNTSDKEYITMIYKALLGRDPDEQGLNDWIASMRNGESRRRLLNDFIRSGEFDSRIAGYEVQKGGIIINDASEQRDTAVEFIYHLYINLLDRYPESSETERWFGIISRGEKSAADIIKSILDTEEYKSRTLSNKEYVNMLLDIVATRFYVDNLRADWTNELNSGYTRGAILRKFVETNELTMICRSIRCEKGEVNVGGWFNDKYGYKHYVSPDSGIDVYGYTVVDGNHCYFDKNGILRTNWGDLKTCVDTSSEKYTYNKMLDNIEALAQQYPTLVTVKSIGKTMDGRQLYDVILSSNKNAEKQLVIQGGCHAREYMTSMLVMNQAEDILRNYWTGSYNGKSYMKMLEEYQIHFVPMTNPDGITLSQEGLIGLNNFGTKLRIMRMYTKDRQSGRTNLDLDTYLKKWKANANGVDLNRNFDSDWESNLENPEPCSEKYRGPYPESEFEIQALTSLIDSLPNVQAVISYHSEGSLVYWAYGQTGDFRTSCRNMAEGIRNITGYYLLNGDDFGPGCSNWVASQRHIRAATIEIGSGSSPLPYEQYPGIWAKNKNVIPYLLSSF